MSYTLHNMAMPDGEQARRLHESPDDTIARLLNEAAKFVDQAVYMHETNRPGESTDCRKRALALIGEANELMQRESATGAAR